MLLCIKVKYIIYLFKFLNMYIILESQLAYICFICSVSGMTYNVVCHVILVHKRSLVVHDEMRIS